MNIFLQKLLSISTTKESCILNQKGNLSLWSFFIFFLISATMTLSIYQKLWYFKDTKQNLNLYLCTQKIIQEYQKHIVFIAQTNQIIISLNNFQKIGYLMTPFGGVQSVLAARKLKEIIIKTQDIKNLIFKQKIFMIAKKYHCSQYLKSIYQEDKLLFRRSLDGITISKANSNNLFCQGRHVITVKMNLPNALSSKATFQSKIFTNPIKAWNSLKQASGCSALVSF